MYRDIDQKILKELASVLPAENIFTERDEMKKYAEDESPDLFYMPSAVVRPENQKQVQDIVKLANSFNFPLTARGGGTGLAGSALPALGGVVISFELMDNIIDIDKKNRMAVVQPGVINGVFQEAAQKEGLFYPVNPASMDSCTLGGNLAQATGGANTVRYGTTRNYITGLKAVTGAGKNWQAGGKVVKNSTDAPLIQLACGSEGTLTLFTELTFRLINSPPFNSWIIAPFKDIEKIPQAASEVFNVGLNPTMVELMDSATLELCSRHLGREIEFSSFNYLLVRYDCDTAGELEKHNLKSGDIFLSLGAEDVLVADTPLNQEKIWEMRSSVHEAIVNEADSVCEEDIVVPVGKVSGLIKESRNLAEKFGYRAIIFGHLGDGNMHINIVSDKSTKKSAGGKNLTEFKDHLFNLALSLGGRLSGEHGIGLTKKPYFKKYIDPGYIELLKKIKKDFDPNNILNPGKIV